ncbi:MAG: GNAT family N-acetyltransferase [Bacteroidales bacterium]|nr:GNAT family N-acetyltransferase [Bacteroidales bacterium]
MIDFEPLSESRHESFAEDLFESAFPKAERPPFGDLEKRNDQFHFLVATLDDEPLGILTYWTFDEFTYIEHFAIAKEYRNRGLGKATILTFMAQHPDQVVLETEEPSTEMADHRLEFYTDLGFTRNPQDYWQPSYHGKGLALPMIVMSKYELDDGEFDEMRSILYREVYHYEGPLAP